MREPTERTQGPVGQGRGGHVTMPKLVSIAVEGPEQQIAVDDEGRVWRGKVTTERGGSSYIKWEYLRSEFKRTNN